MSKFSKKELAGSFGVKFGISPARCAVGSVLLESQIGQEGHAVEFQIFKTVAPKVNFDEIGLSEAINCERRLFQRCRFYLIDHGKILNIYLWRRIS